jgi:hypothetical protein
MFNNRSIYQTGPEVCGGVNVCSVPDRNLGGEGLLSLPVELMKTMY